MKKTLLIFLLISSFFTVSAQHKNSNDSTRILKKLGRLNGDEIYYNPRATKKLQLSTVSKKGSHNNSVMSSTSCNGWIPRDSSFHVVPFDGSGTSSTIPTAPNYANDDWSTYGMTLPFNFCFYGTNVGNGNDSLYINNNGNISFGAPYSTYSAIAFPSNQYVMIAPFWSDVDTDSAGSRYVWYKMTSTYLIIQWDSVGYYDAHADKRNTYQLIITDGNDPILPSGNNISFSYGDMQWTTGDASGGSGGFGGSPATVGINKGDSVNYIQVSLFDNNGSTFTNPSGTPNASGVNWLDYKSFYFNACGSGNNIAPLATSGLSPCGEDTLTICAAGDSLIQTVNFIGPEPAQTVSIIATGLGALAGKVSVINSAPGSSASLAYMIHTTGLTAGFYTITVTGTDNGTPVLSTTLTYIVHILNAAIPNPAITVNPLITCGSTPATITLSNNSSYNSYTWSTGATTSSISVAATSTVYVTVTKSGCSKTGSAVAQIYSNPNPTINGALNICPPSTGTTLFVTQPITGGTAPFVYSWDGGTSTSYSLAAGPGIHSVVVADAHGCVGSASITVTTSTAVVNPVTISSSGNFCTTGNLVLSSSITNGTSYLWSPGGGTSSTFTATTAGTYSLAVSINGCNTSTTYSLSSPITPTITPTGNMFFCVGSSTTLTATANPVGTYSYTWFNGATALGSNTTQVIDTASNVFTVTGINNNTQCRSTTTFTVISYNNPTASVNGNNTICASKPHDLLTAIPNGANGPYTYSWTPSAVSTQTLDATSAHTYSVVVTDSKGCKVTATKLVKLSNPALHMLPYYVCPSQSVVMTAHGSGTLPLAYTWYPGALVSTTYTAATAGTYSVAMTDAYGCKDSITVSVIQNPKPHANFSINPASPEDNVPISFSDISTIVAPDSLIWDSWNFGDGDTVSANQNPVHTYTTGGTYTVTLVVENQEGCFDIFVKNIVIEYAIIAPNIITPNGDGLNEFLAFKNLQYYKNNKLWIYNRWGTKIFEDDDYKNNWTGKDHSDGTYFYILEVPEKHKTFKGFFESIK
ncbi:MAG TPA: nidogen-like domain-containing protein [Bacteroidia bacterium]|jgi:gliding motility-associated-like protein|nr:nidogen-like domain-containing protein [Bacteroidia bacterium]